MTTTTVHQHEFHPSAPRISRILIPPTSTTASLTANHNQKQLAGLAVQALAARTDPWPSRTRSNGRSSCPQPIARHVCTPHVAYLLQQEGSTKSSSNNALLCVQDTVTNQVIWNIPWVDLAVIASGKDATTASSSAAASFMGECLSLAFYDPATLHWSGMMTTSSTCSTTIRWQSLVIQTSKRILMINLQCSSTVLPHHNPNLIMANLSESNLSATPSSNVLPLTEDWLLVGCNDGSLKCYSRLGRQVVKSIKGLGKGDWMVSLQAANPYCSMAASSSTMTCTSRRMLAVTKKGVAYLIPVELVNNNNNNSMALEIKPPLARFMVSSESSASMVQYDAHYDWILWCRQSQEHAVLSVWNLPALQQDLIKQQPQQQQGGIQPEPSLQLELVGGNAVNMIQTVGIAAAEWGSDQATLLVASASATGDFYLQGAVVSSSGQHHAVSQTTTPILQQSLAELLQRHVEGLDDCTSLAGLRVLAMQTCPLGPTCFELLICTNVGLFVLEFPALPMTAVRHLHFGAGFGSLGKSLLYVKGSDVVYCSVDTTLTANPVGHLPPKNPVVVYSSGPTQTRPFRASRLLPSPSGAYVAVWWPVETRYEILHVASLFAKVEQARGGTGQRGRNPSVDTGTGIADFCWVGDSDVYALLHARDLSPMLQDDVSHHSGTSTTPKLKDLGASVKNVAASATVTMVATMAATKAATSKTLSVTKAATSKTLSTTMAATKTVNKGIKKASFGLFGGGKKKKGRDEGGMADMTEDDDVSESVSSVSIMSQPMTPLATAMPAEIVKEKARYVELRKLEPVETQASELSGSIPAATSTSLGRLTLRGRMLPTVLFGGPVLCVGSRSDEHEEGEAHFYTRKKDEADDLARAYSSTGPTLPYPDLCAWDDDGRFCAIAIGSRVAIYLSEEPNFCLLGTIHIGSVSVAHVTSLKFVHSVLYCCTWNAVYCVLMGDLSDGEICQLDSYLLATTDVPAMMAKDQQVNSLEPSPLVLPLVQPVVLGYQSGSLMVSTLGGVYAVPLDHPLLRVGILLSSGQVDRAIKWLDAVPDSDHEGFACFLERRGHPELALQYLPGLSLETIVDLSMRYGYVRRLEDVVETFGARGLRALDMGRGVSTSIFGPEPNSNSMTVCVGAYLLAHGRLELVRQLASECLRLDEQGKKDAFCLGTLLLPVDESDASRLIHRAVEDADSMQGWLMGKFAHDFILKKRGSRT